MKVKIESDGNVKFCDEAAVKALLSLDDEQQDLLTCTIEALSNYYDSYDDMHINRVKFSGPATIIFWSDGDKTVVKCTKEDMAHYDPETGITIATLKKIFGESYPDYKKHVSKLINEAKEAEKKKKLKGYVKKLKEIVEEHKKDLEGAKNEQAT